MPNDAAKLMDPSLSNTDLAKEAFDYVPQLRIIPVGKSINASREADEEGLVLQPSNAGNC